jgi:putative phosphoesterase
MKIGVISDTHLAKPTEDLKALLHGPFQDVDVILHAGDIIEMPVLEAFVEKRVIAVSGNMDSPSVRRQLPSHRVFPAGRFKIGLVHGWGGPHGIEERIAREFEGVNCIVYGHTHTPSQRERNGVLFFNSGAFGGGFDSSAKSVGILHLEDALSGQIFYL